MVHNVSTNRHETESECLKIILLFVVSDADKKTAYSGID